MRQLKAKITDNKKVAQGFYKIRVEAPYVAKNAKPGQFVEVRCSAPGQEPLLRRPFSIHKTAKNEVEMLYQVVGKGTESLAGKKKGEFLDVIGPLGNGFAVGPDKRPAILVAGGVGVAPLLLLAQNLALKRPGSHIIIGAKTKSGVLCEKEFKELGLFVMVSTEDGSKGHKGYATHILGHLLKVINNQASAIYACGPHPMLHACSSLARAANILCQVSMEERMACGLGVCLGCPVKMKAGGYKMACKEGPVFDAREIAW